MIEAAAFLGLSAVLLRTRFRWRFIQHLVRPSQPCGTVDAMRLSELALAVDRAGRLSGNVALCLCRSVTLGRMLNRRGVYPHLRFGIHRSGAHAWLELEGRKIYDWMNAAQQCSPLDSAGSDLNA